MSCHNDAANHVYFVFSLQLTLAALRDWCKGRMADYKIPRALWLCDSIPRNAMGKVNKKHLVSIIPADVIPQE